MTLDIQKIINDKVTGMLENKEIQQKIEETIEKELLRTIADSVSGYDIRRILEEKIKKEVSDEVSTLSFSGYTTKIVKQVAQIIEKEQNKDLAEKVLKEFNALFIQPENEKLTVDKIIDLYLDYIKQDEDNRDKTVYYSVDEEQPYYTKYITIKLSTDDNFDTDYGNNTISIKLSNSFENKDEYTISTVYDDCYNNITKNLKLGYLNSFEKAIINAYYNNTPITDINIKSGSVDLWEC